MVHHLPEKTRRERQEDWGGNGWKVSSRRAGKKRGTGTITKIKGEKSSEHLGQEMREQKNRDHVDGGIG